MFLNFKNLTLEDKSTIEPFVKALPSHSDFNFVSMYSYNTNNGILWTFLNENLVLKFTDYTTDDIFLTFFGRTKTSDTITKLLDYVFINALEPELRMIHQAIIDTDTSICEHFVVAEDRDNFDYVLSVDALISLSGNALRGKRNFVNRFKRTYTNHKVQILNLKEQNVQNKILNLFDYWVAQSEKTITESETEREAIRRLLEASDNFSLSSIGVFVNEQLVGFSINEVDHDRYGVIHFEKGDVKYQGIYPYLKQLSAQIFKDNHCEYINYEQDIGIEGLRKAKLAWQPVRLIKKYRISKKPL